MCKEYELYKVFDSKVELKEDEEEFDFTLGFEMQLDGPGTRQALLLALIME